MKFSEVLGQEEIKQRLIRTVKEERISHAQLFFGPAGVGKLPLAIAYAQYICIYLRQMAFWLGKKGIQEKKYSFELRISRNRSIGYT